MLSIIGSKAICSIAIAINIGGINVIENVDAEGVIRGSGPNKYLVDFSKSKVAKDPDTLTDLSEPILVNKGQCVRLEK